jgi:hypothetical protein
MFAESNSSKNANQYQYNYCYPNQNRTRRHGLTQANGERERMVVLVRPNCAKS